MITKGWDILIQWKDGSTTWEALKVVKESYPVQLADYTIEKGISDETFCMMHSKGSPETQCHCGKGKIEVLVKDS